MGDHAGKAGKCSVDYADYVRSVADQLRGIGGYTIELNECAKLELERDSIIATTKFASGVETLRTLMVMPEAVEYSQRNTRHGQLTGAARDVGYGISGPSSLDLEKFARARQMILERMGEKK